MENQKQLERNPKEDCDNTSNGVRKGLAYGITQNLLLLFLMVSLLMGVSSCGKAKKKRDTIRKQIEMLANEMENGDTQSAKKEKQKDKETGKVRPETFPRKAAEEVADLFEEGETKLTLEVIEKLVGATRELAAIEEKNATNMLETAAKHGYSGFDEYTSALLLATSSLGTLNKLVELEEMLESADAKKKGITGMSTIDVMKLTMGQAIGIGNITLGDVEAAYEYWDELEELSKK